MSGSRFRARAVLAGVTLAAAWIALTTPSARAQDFAPVVPPALSQGAAPLLELGLPPRSTRAEWASGIARPFGLVELDAGWAAAGGGYRALRAALGVARNGEPSIGWDALGVGVGLARIDAGVAVRGVARRDRASESLTIPGEPSGFATGAEIGAGGWIGIGENAHAWVALPQIATRGAAPPLRRALEAGIAWRSGPMCMWLAREAAPRSRSSDAHRAGLALGVPRAWVWAELRDAPLRASVGAAARAGGFAVAAVADLHPVLPPTARMSLSVAGAPW